MNWQAESYISITGQGDSMQCDSGDVSITGGKVQITKGGTYVISGTVTDGQIIVDAPDEKVWLVLDGADITCSNSAAINVRNAKKVIVTAAEGTENQLTDGKTYQYDDAEKEEPNACLYSDDDLVINGSGSLTVSGNCNNGITGKNDVLILDAAITVNAKNHRIRGNDCICVQNASLTVTGGGDGLKSANVEEEGRGFICLESGTYQIQAGEDGIDCATCMRIQDGTYSISAGGGAAAASNKTGREDFGWDRDSNSSAQSGDNSASTKGIKAGLALTIENGTLTIDSADDTLHTYGDIQIEDGTYILSSGDDGIHADKNLTVNGGSITISRSYEGLEAQYITVNGGSVDLVASDDGFNAASGSTQNGGRGGMFEAEDASVTITGGTIVMDAGGDGLDSNGNIKQSGGDVIVYGPTNGGNGALDYAGEYQMNGGTLIAAGAVGMALNISQTSAQCGYQYIADTVLNAGTKVTVQAEDGSTITEFTAKKSCQSLVFSTPAMKDGMSYTILCDGAKQGTVTQSGIASSNGNGSQNGFGGGGFGGGKGGNGQRPNRGQQGSGQMPDQMPQDGFNGGQAPGNMGQDAPGENNQI